MLYSTLFCRLCEEAEAILHKAGLTAIKFDIAADESLFEKYGVRIPVLQRADNDAELAWPFDAAAVSRFLKQAQDSRLQKPIDPSLNDQYPSASPVPRRVSFAP